MLKFFAVLWMVAALAAVHAACAADHTKDSLETVQQNLKDEKALLIDVREQKEWDAGHIDGAVLLPLSELRKSADAKGLAKKLPKDKVLYTHCAAGKRSVIAANILEKLGYDVRPLKPGYKELLEAGFEPAEE